MIESLRRDGRCVLPDRGNDTIHHVHAHDVAHLHLACLQQPDAATGRSFASVSSEALTLRGYASVVARHFGHEPRLSYLPWREWAARTDPEQVALTDDHLSRSPMFSMQKAADVLGFTPLHGVVDTVLEAIDSMLGTMDTDAGVRS